MAELERQRREVTEDERSECVQYSVAGHPSVEQLVADVSVLHGDFWPEEESIEEFLEALHEWRGHAGANPAA